MKSMIGGIQNRNLHLLVGISAAAMAILFNKNHRVRNLFIGISVLEIVNTAIKYNTPAAVQDERKTMASELIQTAMVQGILMRWEEHGKKEGTPIIFVHGFPTHPRLWRYVIPRLALTGSRCLAWEMVGYGWSLKEGLVRDISVSKQAEYLFNWLQHLRIEKAVFVGHDVGGGVVQKLAVDHPHLFRGIVLADSIAYANWPVSQVKLAIKMADFIETLPSTLLKPFFLSALLKLGHDKKARRSESTELHWHPYSRSIGPRAFAHQLRSFHSEETQSISEELKTLKIPARVIWGLTDQLSVSSGKQLSKDLDAPLLMVKNGKHFSPENHPEVFVQAIKGILIEVEEPV